MRRNAEKLGNADHDDDDDCELRTATISLGVSGLMRLHHLCLTALLLLPAGIARGEDGAKEAGASVEWAPRTCLTVSSPSPDAEGEAGPLGLGSASLSAEQSSCNGDAGLAACDCGPCWTATLDVLFL